MAASPQIRLHEQRLSLEHDALARVLIGTENVLIIQDLDGVCMGLVKDPLQRIVSLDYVQASRHLDGHFYVLTNGEHIGTRGVNGIIDRAIGDRNLAREQMMYLPGLAGGGVQWQDRDGEVSHPGVSDGELEFLAAVPDRIGARLQQFCDRHPDILPPDEVAACIDASVLDNKVSPTANLNSFYDRLRDRPELYAQLQEEMRGLMEELLETAKQEGLEDSFFVHYAPNLGRDERGFEILRRATAGDSGTTDFQFMVRGAIKEAGVLVLLNRYYFRRTGHYPLGEDFNVREAPRTLDELLALVTENFDPEQMPLMVGVGDTVSSQVEEIEGKLEARRGGSDRNFLLLIQEIGRAFDRGNLIVYVDSSRGEVKNRKSLQLETDAGGNARVVEGPCDRRDTADPLTLNVAFPGGHLQYAEFFQAVAAARDASSGVGN